MSKQFMPCTECKRFVYCEFGKQAFHKITETPCDEFESGGNGIMREILFRGKTESSEWIEGSLIIGEDIDTGNQIYFIAPLSAYYTEMKKVIPSTVGQYTGLTVNGVKVFEGDIIRVQDEFSEEDFEVGVVVFGKGTYDSGFYKYIGWVRKGANGDVDHKELIIHDFEIFNVIGNIHDNPELLGDE